MELTTILKASICGAIIKLAENRGIANILPKTVSNRLAWRALIKPKFCAHGQVLHSAGVPGPATTNKGLSVRGQWLLVKLFPRKFTSFSWRAFLQFRARYVNCSRSSVGRS